MFNVGDFIEVYNLDTDTWTDVGIVLETDPYFFVCYLTHLGRKYPVWFHGNILDEDNEYRIKPRRKANV